MDRGTHTSGLQPFRLQILSLGPSQPACVHSLARQSAPRPKASMYNFFLVSASICGTFDGWRLFNSVSAFENQVLFPTLRLFFCIIAIPKSTVTTNNVSTFCAQPTPRLRLQQLLCSTLKTNEKSVTFKFLPAFCASETTSWHM